MNQSRSGSCCQCFLFESQPKEKKKKNISFLNRASLVLDSEMVKKNEGGSVKAGTLGRLQGATCWNPVTFQPLILFNLLHAHVRSAVRWTFKVDLDLIKIQLWPSRDPYLAGRGRVEEDEREKQKTSLETQWSEQQRVQNPFFFMFLSGAADEVLSWEDQIRLTHDCSEVCYSIRKRSDGSWDTLMVCLLLK